MYADERQLVRVERINIVLGKLNNEIHVIAE